MKKMYKDFKCFYCGNSIRVKIEVKQPIENGYCYTTCEKVEKDIVNANLTFISTDKAEVTCKCKNCNNDNKFIIEVK